MKFSKSLAITLVLPSLCSYSSGCATTTMTQAEIKFLETRELDLPYDEAYTAATNGLFSLGFTISHSDKESGILTGNRHDPRTGAKLTNALFFGVIGLAATSERNEAVSFMLNALSPEITLLRMKVVVDGKSVVDRELMTNIWQRIEREGMLETRPHEEPNTDTKHRTRKLGDEEQKENSP